MLETIIHAIQENQQADTINEILSAIKENPALSYEELASKTGKSRITISRKLAELRKAGRIIRVGANKNGYWRIEEKI